MLFLLFMLVSCNEVNTNSGLAKADSANAMEVVIPANDTGDTTVAVEQGGFDLIPLVENSLPANNMATGDKKSDMFKQIKFRGKGSEERAKGVEMAAEGNLKGAIEQFTKSIEIFEKNPDAYFYRGKAKWELKDFKGSEDDFSKAILIRPLQAPYYYFRGQMFLEQQKYAEALADFESTIKLAPNYTDALNYKGVVLAKTGKHV